MHINTKRAVDKLAAEIDYQIDTLDDDKVVMSDPELRFVKVTTHRVRDGWIIAHWSDHHCQWQSSDVKGMDQGFRYAFARSLQGLADFGVTTYRSPSEAIRSYLKY